ncbi:MAG TPA: hypothetical protein DCQ93_01555 [Bacteroidetes bacterium]|nr:hypothetical protein [Bacteroidota bacterium]
MIILPNVKPNSSNVSLIVNMIGAVTLSEYVFRKYFPNEKEFQKKKIWKPLIIAVAIFGTLLAITLYMMNSGMMTPE